MNFGDSRVSEKFWEKVSPCPMTGCWLWIGFVNKKGYGLVSKSLAGKSMTSHRMSFLATSTIEPGKQIDHLCRVRCCCNPQHLEAVTPMENTMRGISFAAVNAKKVDCSKGHPFDDENTLRRIDGSRACRACAKERLVKFKNRMASNGLCRWCAAPAAPFTLCPSCRDHRRKNRKD